MAIVVKSYRIRAYPNGAQQRMLARWFGAARWLWNTALEIRSAAHRELGLKLSGNDISRWLTQWKRTAGHEWLAEVPATCLTQCLRNQQSAFANFFERRARYPRFKPRGVRGSLRFQDIGPAWVRGQVSLPKLGKLKLAEELPRIPGDAPQQPFVAKPDMVTLSRDAAGRYFVSFKTEVEIKPLPSTGRVVGVDLGVRELAVLSTGKIIKAPKHYARKLRYLRRQQRILARKQKGSKRREKQKLRVAKAAAHVAAQRTYDLHQLTTGLVREFDVIAIEDLNVKALGRGLLAGSIHDAAFSEFRRQLEYKAGWYGKTVIAVDRWYPSSRMCGCCGHVNADLRLGQGVWKCPPCGTRHNRNIAAAQNLLEEALLQMAGGDRRHENSRATGGQGARTREVHDSGESQSQVLEDEARSGQVSSLCQEHGELT